MNLVNINTNETITTLQLLDMINGARVAAGEPELRNNAFLIKVVDELDLATCTLNVGKNERGNADVGWYVLTIEQATLVGMRESKAVRRAVLDVLKEMAKPKVPTTYIGALEALLESEKAKEAALQLAGQAIATKAEIGNRREATAMNTASQAVKQVNKLEIELDKSKQYASIKRMSMIYHGQKFKWQSLKSASIEMDLPSIDIFDANYETVKAYHADVWREVYALEIEQ